VLVSAEDEARKFGEAGGVEACGRGVQHAREVVFQQREYAQGELALPCQPRQCGDRQRIVREIQRTQHREHRLGRTGLPLKRADQEAGAVREALFGRFDRGGEINCVDGIV
jgi:hypothetical protein